LYVHAPPMSAHPGPADSGLPRSPHPMLTITRTKLKAGSRKRRRTTSALSCRLCGPDRPKTRHSSRHRRVRTRTAPRETDDDERLHGVGTVGPPCRFLRIMRFARCPAATWEVPVSGRRTATELGRDTSRMSCSSSARRDGAGRRTSGQHVHGLGNYMTPTARRPKVSRAPRA
jgi:hypothetical protein